MSLPSEIREVLREETPKNRRLNFNFNFNFTPFYTLFILSIFNLSFSLFISSSFHPITISNPVPFSFLPFFFLSSLSSSSLDPYPTLYFSSPPPPGGFFLPPLWEVSSLLKTLPAPAIFPSQLICPPS